MKDTEIHNWRALHSFWVDAVLRQHPDNRDAIIKLCGGLTIEDFRRSIVSGCQRVRSLFDDDGRLAYRVEILADAGWVGVVRPPATALGINPDEALPFEEQVWKQDLEAQGISDPTSGEYYPDARHLPRVVKTGNMPDLRFVTLASVRRFSARHLKRTEARS